MWGFISFFGPAILTAGAVTLYYFTEHRGRLRTWREAVEKNALTVEEVSSPGSVSLKLMARDGPVEVKTAMRLLDSPEVEVSIQGPPGFKRVSLRRERWKSSGAREVVVGDEAFDSRFFVEGPAPLLAALLDAETRRLLREADAATELWIDGGVLRANVPDGNVAAVLPRLTELGRRWAGRLDVARRLAENTRQDPEPGVRIWNLRLLAREFPEDPLTVEALRAACKDPSAEVRLRAATLLGDEGRNVLSDLAESSEDDSLGAEAVSAVGRTLPVKRVTAILNRALKEDHLQTARICLESLGRRGIAALDRLAEVLESERDEVAAAAALALGETGEGEAEPPLLRVLQQGNPEVRKAAATALGRVGSVAAVLPLRQAAENDRTLRRAARQAIGEIQARLHEGAAPGQLSLAQAEAGHLSLASDPAGQLSLPPERARG